jgi:hypothetical protein
MPHGLKKRFPISSGHVAPGGPISLGIERVPDSELLEQRRIQGQKTLQSAAAGLSMADM